MSDGDPLGAAASLAQDFLAAVGDRPVGVTATPAELHGALDVPLTDEGIAAERVVRELAAAADPGIVASAGPRYLGFVIGGGLPVAVAADWLVSAWDQNPGLYAASPAVAIIEEVAARWVLDVLGLPATASVGFATGATMANLTALAAARNAVFARAGWDVEEDGLQGAPPLRVVLGDEAHLSVFVALRLLGIGRGQPVRVAADDQGRMRPDALVAALRDVGGPTIVVTQAGNVNSGASDPFTDVIAAAHEAGAWVHVDGAFGLWAAASERLRAQVAGVDAADSWATDAHKWLNVPYDCGVVAVRDPAAHRAAVGVGLPSSRGRADAAYLIHADAERDGSEYVPELSRRGRGVTVYAALRHLGRDGVAALVERCCDCASRLAARLASDAAVEVLNEVVLNQVVVRCVPPGGDDADTFTAEVAARLQHEGTCWAGTTRWRGASALRCSFSNWSTTEQDVDRCADAILAAVHGSP